MLLVVFLSLSVSLAESEKSLQIGMNLEFESLHPLTATTVAARYVLYFASRPAAYMDKKSNWHSAIYKKIPNLKEGTLKIVNEKSQKKLIANWELLDNLKWGDGHPITCKDVKFSWQVGVNPNVNVPTKDGYENIESVEWDNRSPKKCVVKYKSAKWNFFSESQELVLPEHIEGPIFEKWGKEKEGYDRNSMYQKDPTNKALWNGPYLISEYKLGSYVVLTPNPHFYGSKPKIQKIIIRIIPNTGTLEANLRSKNIDVISRVGLSLDQALVFAKKIEDEKLPYRIQFADGITYAHIDLNMDNSILSDLKVRQALSYGLNKEEINKALFDGKVTIAHSALSPLDPTYSDDPKVIKIYKTDRKSAKKILDEAGWKVGPDKYRYKDGKKLTLTLIGAAGIKQIETLQSVLQAQWKEIGVDLKLKVEQSRILFSETLKKRKFDMAIFSWSSYPGMNQDSVLNSKNIPSETNTWVGQNYTGFKSAIVDQLTNDYDYEFDARKRKIISDKIMKEYTEQIPVIPLYFRSENAVIPKNFTGMEINGHKYYESLSAENWDLN